MSTRCGTKGYYAPEIVLKQPFGVAVDIWSLGVVLYALLTTQYPFAPTTNLVSS
jgi:serine/threonine protein kinase